MLTQRSQRTQSSQRRKEEADPSTARPDAPEDGAEEKVGPLRSG